MKMYELMLLLMMMLEVVVGDGYHEPYHHHERGSYRERGYSKRYVYHGKYGGSCKSDGLYFRNDASYVVCSNGNDYIQPCAPGTKNRGFDSYSYGDSYGIRDFCAVNLVDRGYGAKHKHYGSPVKVKTVVKAYEKGKERGYGYHEGRKHDYGYDHRRHDHGYGYPDHDHHGYGDDYGHDKGYKRVHRVYTTRYDDDHNKGGYGYRDDHGYGYDKKGYKVKEVRVHYDKKDDYGPSYYHNDGYHNSHDYRPHGYSHHDNKYGGYEYGPKYEVRSYSKRDYGYEKGYKKDRYEH